MNIENQLKKYFGFTSFRKGQKEVVSAILAKQSAGAIFPTGSGKSLCYQLPALLLPHLTIVVSPLIALINDQLQFLKGKGIPAEKIDSTLPPEEKYRVVDSIKNGSCKILFVSVERFKNESFRQFLSKLKISLLVIDEAHCISEWGHNFRPDYLKLPTYQKQFHVEQVLLLTATATPQVVKDMANKFSISKDNFIQNGFYRENLHLNIVPVEYEKKLEQLNQLISKHPKESTIVYVTLQKSAEDVAQYLVANGHNALAYHAGMDSERREFVQNQFMDDAVQCIVATIAFGMGIDKPNIRQVIHYDLPKSLENYSQEIGRAGRDGEVSQCTVLANSYGVNTLENFIYGDTPQTNEVQKLLKIIKKDTEDGLWEFQNYTLSQKTNIKQLPLKTSLVYLEALNMITPSHSYFAEYRVKPIVTEQEILDLFTEERAQFIKAIFTYSSKQRIWYTIQFDKIAVAYPKAERQRIIKALEYLHEKNKIVLECKKLTEVYKVNLNEISTQDPESQLTTLFANKEQAEIERIHKLLAFLESDKCLSKGLSSYFGEELEIDSCNTCSVCKKGAIRIPEFKYDIALDEYNFEDLTKDFYEKSDDTSFRTLTKFLCGITAPNITALKRKKTLHFAALECYPFMDVMNWIQKCCK